MLRIRSQLFTIFRRITNYISLMINTNIEELPNQTFNYFKYHFKIDPQVVD